MCGVRVRVPTHEALVLTRLAAAVRGDTKSGSVFVMRGLFCMLSIRVVVLVIVGRNLHLPSMTISAPQAFQVFQPQQPLLEANPEIRQQLARLLVPVIVFTSLLIRCSLFLLFLLFTPLLPQFLLFEGNPESRLMPQMLALHGINP